MDGLTWMDIRGIILSVIHQTRGNQILYELGYIWNVKTNSNQENPQIHRCRDKTGDDQRWGLWG